MLLVLSLNAVSGFYHSPRYNIDDFKEITEFKQTTERKVGDYWNFESTKRTITEKTEVRKRTRTPIYSSYYYPNYGAYGNSYVPFSNWRFKEPYRYSNYVNPRYDDYYYKPRYDSYQGYYNWRW